MFSITDRDPTTWLGDNRPWFDADNNIIRYSYLPGDTSIFFWSMPKIFKGDKLNSYGGNLTLAHSGVGRGQAIKSSTAIMTGNRLTIHYIREQRNNQETKIFLTKRIG